MSPADSDEPPAIGEGAGFGPGERERLVQAAHWFAQRRAGALSAADEARWRAWLDESPANLAAWEQALRVGERFAPLRGSPHRATAAAAFHRAGVQRGRRRLLGAGIVAAASAGWLGWRVTAPQTGGLLERVWLARYRTGTGEVRHLVLADGTHVWLNAASALDDEPTEALRRLVLHAGEVCIETGTDPRRPFIVDTPFGRLRALGTRFLVRIEDNEAVLAVYEGAVAIHEGGADAQVLEAGAMTRFDRDRVAPAVAAEATQTAWMHGLLIARNLPLREVVARLQRHRLGRLTVTERAGALPVFGSFPLQDADHALAMIQATLPIRVRRPLPGWIRIDLAKGH